ncbi:MULTISPECIES: hypothetical protein [Parachlamydia]|jgi:hypothetical protein|uniref:Uncharacterized protein n=2 Tax=Parachlamydia acanthamoebae TaxID=83552 RepID=F8KXE8_PARAV|nr:hypothetical protein [Parachlamydia acanthamoebae]KIA78624.1 hypothetical protein DB43_DQ00060 [Parachlamydia acanthamoebae]CCB85630.1 putative uncharacterized protein [Parachlamydia acanthamoebae UV-7]
MKHEVEFVPPDRFSYLLWKDWLDRCQTSRMFRAIPKLTPATQAVIIYALNYEGKKRLTPLELAKALLQ